MIVMDQTLKFLMVKVDPFFQVSLPCALSILNDIEREEQKFKLIRRGNDPNQLIAIPSLLKFVYNSCILTIGCRVFDYDPNIGSDPLSPMKPKNSET